MPSLLKSLELHGYKTFASHTNFEFAQAVTAIVGPNGSGKSNIADSIRWVLGEQSYSLLRGKKTEDMIFSGSELRPRASMASATLVFDNSDGWLPIDFSEVAITRRAYRDGENEYLLNGQRVRLKDITELLARSGLAERTYTVIGQGLVDAALALKAEERRRLFEEAAGIGLYRARREETLRRLDITRHNLERVQDILVELLPRLNSLERQARRAHEYESVRADLRLLLRDWYGYHWHQFQQEVTEAHESVRKIEAGLEQDRQKLAAILEKLTIDREQLASLRGQTNSWYQQSSQLHNRREDIRRAIAVADERTRSLYDQQQNTQNEIIRLEADCKFLNEQIEGANREADKLTEELEDARSHMALALKELCSLQDERTTAEIAVQEAQQNLINLKIQQSNLKARIAERSEQSQRQSDILLTVIHDIEIAEYELETSSARLDQANQAWHQAAVTCQTLEGALQEHHKKIVNGEIARRTTQVNHATLQADLTRFEVQKEVLEQAENAYAGYATGARLLLQAARDVRLKGIHGAMSGFLEVPMEYEAAIAAAFGEYLDAVILDGELNTEDALENLSKEIARAALLPLDSLSRPGRLSYTIPSEAIHATDLVQCTSELRPAMDLLLENAWIVADRSMARTLVKQFRSLGQVVPNLRVITKNGEVFYVSGPILAGKEANTGLLSRQRQRRESQSKIAELKVQLEKVDDTLFKVDAALKQLLSEEERLKQELSRANEIEKKAQSVHAQEELGVERIRSQHQFLQEQRERLESEIVRTSEESKNLAEELAVLDDPIQKALESYQELDANLKVSSLEEVQTRVSEWNTRTAVTERAVLDTQNRLRDHQMAMDRLFSEQKAIQERFKSIQLEQEELAREKSRLREAEGDVNIEISELLLLIEPTEKELDDVERDQEITQKSEGQARQAQSLAEHRHTQARIQLARRQEILDGLRQRIEADFGLVAFDYAEEVSGPTPLPLDGMVEQLPDLTKLPLDLEENIKRQRVQLRRMGPINAEAQNEFEEVQQRYQFLSTQVTDLHEAEAGIKEVIAELDLLMEREFRKTFDAVAKEFRDIFARLFGGGTARLVLTDPQDLTMTGIDIEARLPGRREQGLSLLSGGERSLTASALVFSLLKVSPTPFCVFDEVDAMLDEANVGRFRELLEELSQSTQFIIITHNRNTVQVADVIYGVTMGRDSTSQVVSLKLDEVPQIVE